MQRARPLFFDVPCCQTHKLQQCHIVGKSNFGLGHFAHLTVEALDGIRDIDDFPDRFGIMECKLLLDRTA